MDIRECGIVIGLAKTRVIRNDDAVLVRPRLRKVETVGRTRAVEYHKRFSGLGIQATVNFSGSPLPEENRPVALISLGFERVGSDGGLESSQGCVRLGDLPPVLINECWNDIRLAAADGKGFDPNWEKSVQY